MRAVILSSEGDPGELQLQEVETPVIRNDTEIRVRIRAAGVNPIDVKLCRSPGAFPLSSPIILGCDGAGVVEDVGPAVSEFKVGDEVYFCHCGFGERLGNYGEYAVMDQRFAALKPSGLDFNEAAAAPLVLITAWESLHDRVNLREGQDVLVHAGAGGVGHIAIQLAMNAGANVCTTVGSPAKAAFVESLGVEKAIPYKEQDFVESVMEWTDGKGVDVALDTVGGSTFQESFGAVRCYGDLVTLLQPPADTVWSVARKRNLRIALELMLSPVLMNLEDAQWHQGNILKQCAPLFDQGKLVIKIDSIFPLEEAAQAHRLLQTGPVTGKLVLTID